VKSADISGIIRRNIWRGGGRENELAMSIKNKNIRDLFRGINLFKKGYQPRNNLLKDENGDLLADSHDILNR
jgi:hypothetical protein